MSVPDVSSDEGLIRAIGTRALGLNIINMVVGGGIFLLPGLIAAKLGAAAILAYLACSVAVGLVFLCFAEVGSRVTRSGGSYAYIEEAFGPFVGFVASILLWFGWNVLADAAITVAMVETLAIPFPVLSETIPRSIFIVALITSLAAVNVCGVKSGLRLFVFNAIVKLVPLIVLAAVGLFAMNFDNLKIETWPTIPDIGSAALILFFAFSGAESALSSSGEIKSPSKTVPRGILLGLIGILGLYLSLQFVAQGVLGPDLALNTDAPLAATADKVFGSWGSKMLLVGSAISIFATISGDILNTPRVIFAAARDGNLPSILGKVHPKFKTPFVAVIFFSAFICLFALTGTFKSLAVVASGSILIIYLGVSLAVLRLRIKDGLPGADSFMIPGGPVVPVLSCIVVGWLLTQLSFEEAVALVALIAIAIVFYFVQKTVTTR